MHRHILIPTDGSELSASAVAYGVALAKAVGARVTGLAVSVPNGAEAGGFSSAAASAETASHLGQITESAEQSGVSCNVVHAVDEHPYKAIIGAANDKGCDLIVMASHGRRGLSALVLGSETAKVLTHSNIPVLVYRGPQSGIAPPYFAAS